MNSHLETGHPFHKHTQPHDPTSYYQTRHFLSLGCSQQTQGQIRPNERHGRPMPRTNPLASTDTTKPTRQANAPAKPTGRSSIPQEPFVPDKVPKRTAKLAIQVDPISLAKKPVHTPSMERLSRQEQLRKQSLVGQFVKSAGPRKPKGSINVPCPVQLAAKLTNVPASAWPSTGYPNPSQRMWTAVQAKSTGPARPLAQPLHMLTLPDLNRFKHEIRPISPMPVTPPRKTLNTVQESLPQDKNVLKNSVLLELASRQDTILRLCRWIKHLKLYSSSSWSWLKNLILMPKPTTLM